MILNIKRGIYYIIEMTKVTKYNGNVNKQTDVYTARKQEEEEEERKEKKEEPRRKSKI